MRKLLFLLVIFTSCQEKQECIEIGTTCIKCFEDNNDYSEWFNRCWIYSLAEENAENLLCDCQ